MKIIYSRTTTDLGKVKPVTTKTISVADHCSSFFCIDTCDVWTDEGYLVTSVQSDGVTHQLRKGKEVILAELSGGQILHYTPNAQAAHHGF